MRALSALGLLLVAAGACDRDASSAPEKGSDEPAGEVLEARGEVSAIRGADGAEERELSAGDPIYADDTVKTGADSSVRIRLAHNGAAWTLGAGMRREVSRSVAWKAPEASSEEGLLGRREEDRSAAAGRHAEREAASTPATALEEAEPEAPQAEAAAAPAPAEATDAPARAERRRRRRSKSGRKGDRSPPPPARPRKDSFGGEATGAAPGGPRVGGATGAGSTRGGKATASSKERAAPAPRGDALKAKRRPSPASRARAKVRQILRRCFDRHQEAPAGEVSVALTVGEDGKLEGRPELEGSTTKLGRVISCARSRFGKVSFPRGAGRIQVSVDLAR